MNEVQQRLLALQEKGWTLAAIANELEVTVNAVVKWKAGDRIPSNRESIFEHLDRLLPQRRVPLKRRCQKAIISQFTLEQRPSWVAADEGLCVGVVAIATSEGK